MKKALALVLVLVGATGYAGKKKEHRQHEAHVHGGATLSIAFDQLKGKAEFKAAAEGVLGFEHEAKSEDDRKKLNETVAKFEASIGSMVKFDEALGCTFVKEKIEIVAKNEQHVEKGNGGHHGEHSDFIANFTVNCKNEIRGAKVVFDFSQFRGIKDIDVTMLVGDLQKSVEVKKKPVTLELK